MIAAVLGIVLVTLGHYVTDPHNVVFHNIYRRLYYVPVVLSAFAFGLRGGVISALLAGLAYAPHAFFMEHHHDPAPMADKVFEIVLYFGVGGLTGWLVERERRIRGELERSLEERNELERELVRAGKLGAMGELLAGVAHEIRNPLASILGAAEGLERKVEGGSKEEKLVKLQLREVGRLNRVVSKFLAFARTDEPRQVDCDIEELVKQVVELTSHQMGQGDVTIDESLSGARFFADEDQISQILLNFTLNAMQASDTDGFKIEYLCQHRIVAGRAHICVGVRDHGEGIRAEHLEQIFDPYYTTREAGNGLGLALSSRLAETNGGFLDVESDHGKGSTFWVCIPSQEQRG